MRTSVFVAILAVSFTAVLAAPSHPKISHKSLVSAHKIHIQHNLKKISLPEFAVNRITAEAEAAIVAAIAPLLELLKPILPPPTTAAVLAPRVDLPELIALISKAVVEINAAIATAEASLLALLEKTSDLLPEVIEVLEDAHDQTLAILKAALAKALEAPITELPFLIVDTAYEIYYIYFKAVVWIYFTTAGREPDVIGEYLAIVSALTIQIKDALAPLIELISPPGSHAIAHYRHFGSFGQGHSNHFRRKATLRPRLWFLTKPE